VISSGAFSRHRRDPPGLARRQYPGERGGGMFGVRGAYFAGWITVEIDADRACDKALQIHHALGVDAQNRPQLAPSENRAAGQDVGSDPDLQRPVWQVFFEYECLRKPFGEARQSGVHVFLRDRHQFSIGDDRSRKFPRSLSLPNRREALAWTAIHQHVTDAGGAHFAEGVSRQVRCNLIAI
jgi:hypothetical protein